MADRHFFSYDEATGIVIPDTLKIRECVLSVFQDAYGPGFTAESSTPAGVVIDSLAQMFAEQAGIVAQNGNGFNLNLAMGKWLDGIGVLLNIERHPISTTRFVLDIKCDDPIGTEYLKDTIIVEDANSNIYYNETNFTKGNGNVYSVTFYSKTFGEIEDNLTSIKLKVNTSTLSIVDFVELIERGKEEESDFSYRNRLGQSLSRGSGYSESISNAIMSADTSVEAVKIGKNYKCAYIEQDGIVYPPCACCIVVKGYSSPEAIQEAIEASVPIGCGFCSDIGAIAHEFQMSGRLGTGYTGYWHEAIAKTVDVSYSITSSNSTVIGEDTKKIIEDKTKEYFSSLGIGPTIKTDVMIAWMSYAIPGIRFNDIRLNEDETGWYNTLNIPISSYPVPNVKYL